jgi:hypothetical protein
VRADRGEGLRARLYPPPSEALLDLNPIEQVFSKDKGRRAVARTREPLIGVLGRALSAVTARDARGPHRALWIPSSGPIPIDKFSMCTIGRFGLI